MRIKQMQDAKGRERLVVIFSATRARGCCPYETYALVRRGRRLAVVEYDPKYPEDTFLTEPAFEAGPKTLQRVLESALNGGGERLMSWPVPSVHGSYLEAEPNGRHVYFTAPCGHRSRVTKAELKRVLDAIPQL